MWCSYCGSKLHTVVNCPKTWGGSASRTHMRCSYCGSKKHNVEACPKTWNGSADRKWNKEKIKDNFIKD